MFIRVFFQILLRCRSSCKSKSICITLDTHIPVPRYTLDTIVRDTHAHRKDCHQNCQHDCSFIVNKSKPLKTYPVSDPAHQKDFRRSDSKYCRPAFHTAAADMKNIRSDLFLFVLSANQYNAYFHAMSSQSSIFCKKI